MIAIPQVIETRLKRWFALEENGTNVGTEIRAGLTSFITASYIIFVQPAVLSQAGMDFGSVMTATCLASALGCLLMGLLANYPILLAPGMGINFYFTYTVVIGQGIPWETALGAVFISGILLIILTLLRVREAIIVLIPNAMKCGIAVGIGLFIAFIGMTQGGLVVDHPDALVQMGDLRDLPALFTLFGVTLMGALLYRKTPGAILIGLLVLTALAVPLGLAEFKGIISSPPGIGGTWMKMELGAAFDLGIVTIIAVFVFVDIFDTAGTLVGVGQQGGFIKDGKLPRAQRALLPDAVATTFGASAGVSTVVCYIESSAGVAEGGRTGLTSVVAGLLFLFSLWFFPIAEMIGGGYRQGDLTLYPITAPVLIIVGCMMVSQCVKINWSAWDEALPAYLIICGIPFTYSIADGMALGFISYPLIQLLGGKGRECHWGLYAIAAAFLVRFAWA